VILLILLVGPFLVPVPPLEGLKPAEDLADPDSLFMEINDLTVHYKTRGEGMPVFILLHGFGASLYSWQAVFQPLSAFGSVIAYDRPAFGLTERPLEWEGENPYSSQAQVNLLLGLMEQLEIESAILVGNSAGGSVAMEFYRQYPDKVDALILVDPAVYTHGGAVDGTRWLLRTPQMQHLGPLIARQIQVRGPELLGLAWYDPSRLSAETIELYKKPLLVENWDLALWEMTMATSDLHLDQYLDEFTLPILVITGEADQIVPTEQSIRLAEELPDANLVVISQAGHVPHEEQPELFMEAVKEFLVKLP
jgi:pimeloyl-ACP methyl ester carboxylesterase